MGSHRKVVIALGGNALQDAHMQTSAATQLEIAKRTAEVITDIKCIFGYEIAIAHGNGPQVGEILLMSECAKDLQPVFPLDVCSAMSQGYIGYHLQQSLTHALTNRKRSLPVVTLITQVVVDKDDPAFNNPTKPIGSFYSEEVAKKLIKEKGFVMKEDAGRGWRRVVPSPLPKKILEIHAIKQLWDSTIVITVGGGGIPVIEKENGTFEGIAAVIDKDYAAERLAEEVGADVLLILTDVEKVCINYKKLDQKELSRITPSECKKLIDEGHFASGSMLPKVTAALKFAESGPGKMAIITALDKAVAALNEETGTIITMSS